MSNTIYEWWRTNRKPKPPFDPFNEYKDLDSLLVAAKFFDNDKKSDIRFVNRINFLLENNAPITSLENLSHVKFLSQELKKKIVQRYISHNKNSSNALTPQQILCTCIQLRLIDFVKELVESSDQLWKNALVESDSSGVNVLQLALRCKEMDIVNDIIEQGDIGNILLEDGETLFHYFSRKGDKEMINKLFKKQPNVIDRKNQFGWTPLNIALSRGHKALADWMMKYCLAVKTESNLDELSDDVFMYCLEFISPDSMSLINLKLVCKSWNAVIDSEDNWELKCKYKFGYKGPLLRKSWKILGIALHRARLTNQFSYISLLKGPCDKTWRTMNKHQRLDLISKLQSRAESETSTGAHRTTKGTFAEQLHSRHLSIAFKNVKCPFNMREKEFWRIRDITEVDIKELISVSKKSFSLRKTITHLFSCFSNKLGCTKLEEIIDQDFPVCIYKCKTKHNNTASYLIFSDDLIGLCLDLPVETPQFNNENAWWKTYTNQNYGSLKSDI